MLVDGGATVAVRTGSATEVSHFDRARALLLPARLNMILDSLEVSAVNKEDILVSGMTLLVQVASQIGYSARLLAG